MQVLIMRHGDAALEAASDAERPLTTQGRDQSRLMANWLNSRQLDVDRVLVSPYLRAQQTLAVVRESMTLPRDAQTLPELTPGGDIALVQSELRALAGEGVGTVLIISHLPLVGYMVADLCPEEQAPMFATSAVACVELEADGQGKLVWQVSPAQLAVKV